MDDDLGTSVTHPYTCLSCSLAFVDTASQREHYVTDLHRYNSKRRVAGLGPVTYELFNEKVLARTDETEEVAQGRLNCKACNKTFNTAATQTTHNLSKKHKEAVFRAASAVKVDHLTPPTLESTPEKEDVDVTMDEALEHATLVAVEATPVASSSTGPAPPTIESSGDAKLDELVAKRIIAAPPIPPTTCLFCPHTSDTVQDSAIHMRAAHSFVIPEEEYLVDLEGLVRRLGEEVGTWNVCVCCGKGYGGNINLDSEGQTDEEMRKKASKGVEAVRNHMKSKSHCKLPYNTDSQRLDLADFYDFRPSYPDYVSRKERKALKNGGVAQGEDWEDLEANGEEAGEDDEGLEVVYESASEETDSDDDDLPESGITYGDSSYELVLPSGARIGHRAHKNIHKQNLAPYLGQNPFKPSAHSSPHTAYKPSPHSAALLSLVPSMQRDRTHARPLYDQGLVPARGAGFGGNGDVIRARNKGEAKNANKSVRNFTELKARARQEFVRGVKANSQEHYRDHLLQ